MSTSWFSPGSSRRYAAKLRAALKQLLEQQDDPYEGGDAFYALAEAAVVEAFQRSLKGTPDWLVPDDHYELAISPATRQDRHNVLALYRASLIRKLRELEAAGQGALPQVGFACPPSVEFVDSDSVADDRVEVRSSASAEFQPEQPAAPFAHAPPKQPGQAARTAPAGTRALHVRWEDNAGTKEELTLQPTERRSPVVVGRGEMIDTPYRMTTSLDISRQHAYFYWESGAWWLGDGPPDGPPSEQHNGTTLNGKRVDQGQIQQLTKGDRIGFPDRDAAEWTVLDC